MLDVIIISLLVIIVSMTLHEVSHAYVAYWLGDDTAKAEGRLTLNPLKHLDPVMSVAMPLIFAIIGAPIFGGAKPVPLNFSRIKWGDAGVACVAIAGPLVNLLIAYISFSILYYSQVAYGSLSGTILIAAVQINLGFFVFNMLPIPPLDGSRILYALAPEFVRKIMAQIERYGIFIVMCIAVFMGPVLSTVMTSITLSILQLFEKLVI